MLSRINSALVVGFVTLALLVGLSGVARADLVSLWTMDDNASNATITNAVNATYNGTLSPSETGSPAQITSAERARQDRHGHQLRRRL